MYLITETTEDIQCTISESSEDSKKNYFIEGIFMQANKKNRNGRIYPTEILQKEAKRYTTEFIKKKRAFGELGHPDGPTVNLERVSHMIEELEEVDQNFMGRAKILDTPYGNIVKNLIDEGAQLGVSSRGMGSVKQVDEATVQVEDDFELICWDFVSNPSTQGAFMKQIQSEGILAEQAIKNNYSYIKVNTIIRDILCEMKGCCPVE